MTKTVYILWKVVSQSYGTEKLVDIFIKEEDALKAQQRPDIKRFQNRIEKRKLI